MKLVHRLEVGDFEEQALPAGEHRVELRALAPGFALDALVVEKEERDWQRVLTGLALMASSLVVLAWAHYLLSHGRGAEAYPILQEGLAAFAEKRLPEFRGR